MRTLFATCVAAGLMLGAGGALADDYYGGNSGYYGRGYGNGYDAYNRGYDGRGYGYARYDRGYDPYNRGYYRNGYGDYYGNLYRNYLNYLAECRQHQRLHYRLHQYGEEGYREGYDHRDVNEALRATHDQYHRNHPSAGACPTFEQYRARAYYGWRGGNNGYNRGNDYWRY